MLRSSSCRSARQRTGWSGRLTCRRRPHRDGEHAFSPGLLARAHGGVLYVDEVNLLHDHLVDVILDAAASGSPCTSSATASRTVHQARFVLIGTMKPEEGELRPQLLDRFGLTVDVRASRDVDVRVDVIRQRMAFEADPVGFADRYVADDAEIGPSRHRGARGADSVRLPDNELRRIAALCSAFDVDGMRADLVVARTAVAHAAWRGADTVAEEDIRVAAELALPHRRRRDPFDDPGLDPDQLDDAMAQAAESADEPEPEPDPDPQGGGDSISDDGSGQPVPQRNSKAPRPDRVQRRRRCFAQRRWWCRASAKARRAGGHVPETGWERRSRRPPNRGAGHGMHVFGTLLAAAGRQSAPGRLRPGPDDVRRAIREGREGNLVIFVVDARARWPRATGCRRSAVRRCRCCETHTSAATRWPCHHVPAAGRPAVVAADVVGAHRGPQAGPVRHRRGKRHWRKACWPHAMWWCAKRRVTGRGAAWLWCSP